MPPMNYSISGGLHIDVGFQVHSFFQLSCRLGPHSVTKSTSGHELCHKCSTQLIPWAQGEEEKRGSNHPSFLILPCPVPLAWWIFSSCTLSLSCLACIAKPLGRLKVAFTLPRILADQVQYCVWEFDLVSVQWTLHTEDGWINEVSRGWLIQTENEQTLWNKPREVNKHEWLRFTVLSSHISDLSVAILVNWTI